MKEYTSPVITFKKYRSQSPIAAIDIPTDIIGSLPNLDPDYD